MASAELPAARTLVLGGIRSGKSGYAESLLPSDASVRYLATARWNDDDQEWSDRIVAHRQRRPQGWQTLERVPLARELVRGSGDPLLVEDITSWLTGELDDAGAWEGSEDAVTSVGARVDELVRAVEQCPARLVLVSAEVGLGVIPATRSGRLFADELGALNARLAQVCDEVVLVVAGIPLTVRRREPSPAQPDA
ncbi:MAG TPA: bifunctional adenosylcobinamide kinase/adenosylcobinamide-phosphate guanylyltransferase [Pseudonocardia sp.]|nr:bifunctional adenosylcobinamide kinase/adenosylcobinamide-phosphate guanylyltransferase [Pseudonocardia sp.]